MSEDAVTSRFYQKSSIGIQTPNSSVGIQKQKISVGIEYPKSSVGIQTPKSSVSNPKYSVDMQTTPHNKSHDKFDITAVRRRMKNVDFNGCIGKASKVKRLSESEVPKPSEMQELYSPDPRHKCNVESPQYYDRNVPKSNVESPHFYDRTVPKSNGASPQFCINSAPNPHRHNGYGKKSFSKNDCITPKLSYADTNHLDANPLYPPRLNPSPLTSAFINQEIPQVWSFVL